MLVFPSSERMNRDLAAKSRDQKIRRITADIFKDLEYDLACANCTWYSTVKKISKNPCGFHCSEEKTAVLQK